MTRIRTSLQHAPREPKTEDELKGLARKAWLDRGILMVWLSDLTDDWERQTLVNVGNRLYGIRKVSC